ncbi:MAG: hypothetical protein HYR88_17460 [Verrucomicrobia bacterium]|nr:hypothetical protein [Verrucomicrobiota bacterium]MBI3870937.1 hypothetical protein [Verrucomicrobiota bacterium]
MDCVVLAGVLGFSMAATTPSRAATVLSGEVSGTWTADKSPYVLVGPSSVASNQVLRIEPGVVVIIGPDIRLAVFGGMDAVGAPDAPITIRAANSASRFNGVYLQNIESPPGSTRSHKFHYVRFSDAQYALWVVVQGGNNRSTLEVFSCEFFNCYQAMNVFCSDSQSGSAFLGLSVRNCVFENCSGGCGVFLYEGVFLKPSMDAVISANIFKSAGNPALVISGPRSPKSHVTVRNNTFAFCMQGISSPNNFSDIGASIRNNLFYRNGYAVTDPWTPQDTQYNCFFGNGTNFNYYPGIYGIPILANHNGDPCDAFNNILLDPKINNPSQFLLSDSSPCIDAGDPDIQDVCFNFSKGGPISDIGAYGGPDACNWLNHRFSPVIASAPADQANCVGGSVAFEVQADGAQPLTYSWYFNRTNLLAGETGAKLSLGSLTSGQAGLYSVRITNSFGSVTSAPVSLRVSDACVGMRLYAGLSITGVVGRTYTLESSTNAVTPIWVPVASRTFTQATWLAIDTNTPFDAQKFFRVRILP